jgi:hypothetical protein
MYKVCLSTLGYMSDAMMWSTAKIDTFGIEVFKHKLLHLLTDYLYGVKDALLNLQIRIFNSCFLFIICTRFNPVNIDQLMSCCQQMGKTAV